MFRSALLFKFLQVESCTVSQGGKSKSRSEESMNNEYSPYYIFTGRLLPTFEEGDQESLSRDPLGPGESFGQLWGQGGPHGLF